MTNSKDKKMMMMRLLSSTLSGVTFLKLNCFLSLIFHLQYSHVVSEYDSLNTATLLFPTWRFYSHKGVRTIFFVKTTIIWRFTLNFTLLPDKSLKHICKSCMSRVEGIANTLVCFNLHLHFLVSHACKKLRIQMYY
jgi:hypothetical protein